MPGASDIKAGAAFVELYTKNNKFVRGLDAAQARLRAFGVGVQAIGTRIMGVGGAALAPMLAAAAKFSSTGDQLHKMAERTGMSTNALSELGFAAERSGASLEDVGGGVKQMQNMLGRASRGLSRAKFGLNELGLSYEQLQNLSPEEQFMTIAEELSKVEDASRKAYLAQIMFGGSSQKLLPLLNSGAEGIAAMRKEAQELSLSVDPKDAEAAAALGDSWGRVKDALEAVLFKVGASVAPMLTEMGDRITTVVATISRWISENRELIATAAKIAAGIFAAGAAVTAIGAATVGAGAILGSVSAIIGTFGSVVGIAGTVLGALVSPIGLVTSALAAGAGAWLYFSGNGAKAIDFLFERWKAFSEGFMQVFGGIRDALAAGDLALAGKVAMKALEVVWQTGLDQVLDLWYGFRNSLLDIWNGMQLLIGKAVFGLVETITSGISKLLEMLQNVAGRIPGIGDSVVAAIQRAQDATDFGTDVSGMAGRMIEDNLGGRIGARNRAETNRQAAARKEMAALREELAALSQEASIKAEIARADKLEQEGFDPTLPDMGSDMGGAQEKMSSIGAFSAFKLQGIGGKNLDQEQLDELRQVVSLLDDQNSEIRNSNLTFAG